MKKMTTLDALHIVCRASTVVLQIAREEKPSGSWPDWAVEADAKLFAIQRELRAAAKKNLARRERDQAMHDLGLKRVVGALGGVYWE